MPLPICIKNGNLILPDKILENDPLFIEDGKICSVGREKKIPGRKFNIIDAKELYVSPGFIDIHAHGIFCSAIPHPQESDLKRMCGQMTRAGVTSFLATTVSLPVETLLNTVRMVKSFFKDNPSTNLLGLHLEGPYINPSQGGAHNHKYIRPVWPDELREIFSAANGCVRMMTFAPEIKGGMKLLDLLVENNVVGSIGHSAADYREVERFVRRGLKHITHLFNAMPPFHHRKPGVVGASLTMEDLSVDIISDGLHLHPSAVKLTIRAKGADKIILISDFVSGTGVLKDGRLAGGRLGLNRLVENTVNFGGISLPEAVRMATLNPARLLGIEGRKGSLKRGKDADIIVFDEDFSVRAAIVKGDIIFNRT